MLVRRIKQTAHTKQISGRGKTILLTHIRKMTSKGEGGKSNKEKGRNWRHLSRKGINELSPTNPSVMPQVQSNLSFGVSFRHIVVLNSLKTSKIYKVESIIKKRKNVRFVAQDKGNLS